MYVCIRNGGRKNMIGCMNEWMDGWMSQQSKRGDAGKGLD